MSLKLIWFLEPALSLYANLPDEHRPLSILTKSSDEQYHALLSGKADAAITSMDNVMDWNLRESSKDFVIIAQMEKTTHLTLMGRPGLVSIEDIKGGVLLVDAPANGFVVAARKLLSEYGMGASDYELIPSGGVRERYDALVLGNGDAALLGPPFDLQAEAAGATILAKVNDRYPTYPGQGLVIRKSRLVKIREELARWLSLLAKAINRSHAEPDDLVAIFQEHGLPERVACAFAASLPVSLVPDPLGVETVISQRREVGLRGGDVTYSDLVLEI